MKSKLVKINTLPNMDWAHDFYSVYYDDNNGYIINTNTGKILEPFNQGTGRCQIWIYGKGKKEKKYPYDLVALAFVPNPKNKPCINHLDENPNNNHPSNLEWCTLSENSRYGTKFKRAKANKMKAIVRMDAFGNMQVISRRTLKIIYGNIMPILRCCGAIELKCKRYKGYVWSYLTTYDSSQLSFNF